MSSSSNTNYIIPTAIIGAGSGAIYGFRHPSEEACQKISFLHPTVTEAMNEYKNSFNMDKAAKALKNKKLTKDEFKIVEEIVNNLSNIIEKEENLNKVANTPFNERVQSFRSALKDANKSHFDVYKSFIKFSKNLQNKLIDLNVFDLERFSNNKKSVAKKALKMYKIVAQSAIKPIMICTGVGAAFGLFLNKIAHKA